MEYVDPDESDECECMSECESNSICEYEAVVKTVRIEVSCKGELSS